MRTGAAENAPALRRRLGAASLVPAHRAIGSVGNVGARLTARRIVQLGRDRRGPSFGNQHLRVVRRQIEEIAHMTLRQIDPVHALREAPRQSNPHARTT